MLVKSSFLCFVLNDIKLDNCITGGPPQISGESSYKIKVKLAI